MASSDRSASFYAKVFLYLAIADKLLTGLMFLRVLMLMRTRKSQALGGSAKAAKRIILPCYKPMLRGLFVLYVTMALAILGAQSSTGNTTSSNTSRYFFIQGLGFIGLTVYSIAPVLMLQRSVSATGFWRTASTIIPWVLVCLALWIIQFVYQYSSAWRGAFSVFSCVPPLILFTCMLLGFIKSRIRLKSASNKACVEYALVYTLLYMVGNLAGTAIHHQSDQMDTDVFVIAGLSAVALVMDLFFPFALYRTLLADTKYWRGLGKHNRGGIKFNDAIESGMVPAPQINEVVASTDLQQMLEAHQNVVLDFAYLQVGSFLGKGSSADVYKGKLRGVTVAIKVFTPPEVTAEEVSTFAVEAAITSSLTHPNIITFFGICVKPPQVAMVFEFCANGDLKSLLGKSNLWTTRKRLEAALDAARALEYLHSCKLIHRDIKAENFFVDEDWNIKLGDFGESTLQRKTDEDRKMTIVGTVAHMAPELINAAKHYSEAVDVYSLGITFWEIATSDDPFKNLNTFEVYKMVLDGGRPPVPRDCRKELAECMQYAWAQVPSDRASAGELAVRLQEALDSYVMSAEYEEDRAKETQPTAQTAEHSGPLDADGSKKQSMLEMMTTRIGSRKTLGDISGGL